MGKYYAVQKDEVVELDDTKKYFQCAMCGVWKENVNDEFGRQGGMPRTNCLWCFENYAESKRLYEGWKNNPRLKEKLKKIPQWLYVEEVIEHLKKLPAGARVFIGQSGYYADGNSADFFPGKPEKKEFYGGEYWEIGHSEQNV